MILAVILLYLSAIKIFLIIFLGQNIVKIARKSGKNGYSSKTSTLGSTSTAQEAPEGDSRSKQKTIKISHSHPLCKNIVQNRAQNHDLDQGFCKLPGDAEI